MHCAGDTDRIRRRGRPVSRTESRTVPRQPHCVRMRICVEPVLAELRVLYHVVAACVRVCLISLVACVNSLSAHTTRTQKGNVNILRDHNQPMILCAYFALFHASTRFCLCSTTSSKPSNPRENRQQQLEKSSVRLVILQICSNEVLSFKNLFGLYAATEFCRGDVVIFFEITKP